MAVALATALWVGLGAQNACAEQVPVVVEVDAQAETLVDERVVRRLIALELADIDVPPSGSATGLFYRVRGTASGGVEIELWEVGNLRGQRLVSRSEGRALAARRVALAAAELARGLRQQRIAERRAQARERARRRARAAERRRKRLEEAFVVRSAAQAARGTELTLFGPSLAMGIGVHGPTRLELGARLLGARDDTGRATLTFYELALGPARRFALTPTLALDVAALGAVSAVHVGGATGVDGIVDQRETWTARAGLAVRLEPRLGRLARLSLGVEAGSLLRAIPATFDSEAVRYRGPYAGVDFGIVITPR
ncbi:MAG: hypothetical protein DIU78_014085 [Pseudomonadota bacterium]